jgi:hypothetical protein
MSSKLTQLQVERTPQDFPGFEISFLDFLEKIFSLVRFRIRIPELTNSNRFEIWQREFAVSESHYYLQQLCGFGSDPKSQKHLFLEQLKSETDPHSQLPQDFDGLWAPLASDRSLTIAR